MKLTFFKRLLIYFVLGIILSFLATLNEQAPFTIMALFFGVFPPYRAIQGSYMIKPNFHFLGNRVRIVEARSARQDSLGRFMLKIKPLFMPIPLLMYLGFTFVGGMFLTTASDAVFSGYVVFCILAFIYTVRHVGGITNFVYACSRSFTDRVYNIPDWYDFLENWRKIKK